MPQEQIRHISTAQLAQYLGISAVAVFKRIQKGRIKAVKIGRSYAIPESYVQEHFPGYKFEIIEKGDYLSVMEAARVLGLSRVTVFNRIKDGTIKAKRIGRHYVIPKNEITSRPINLPRLVSIISKEYYSVPQFAQLLGISRIAVFKKIKKGALKAQKVGRSFVIGREEIVTGEKAEVSTQPYMSVKELAKQLGISRIAVFKKIKKGQIKAVRIGRSYVILKELFKNNT